MSSILHVIVLDRHSMPQSPTQGMGLLTKKILRSFEWTINMDGVSATTSHFRVLENIRNDSDVVSGDIIIVNPGMGMIGNNMQAGPAPGVGVWTRGLYFGVVDTIQEDTIRCRDLTSLFNVRTLFRTNTQNEPNPHTYLQNRMQEVQVVPGMHMNFIMYRLGHIPSVAWAKTFDRPQVNNLSGVMSEIFTYNQCIVTPQFYQFNINNQRTFIEMLITHQGNIQPIDLDLDDESTFFEVDVFIQERNVSSPNLLRVWNDEGYAQAETWVRLQDGTVTSFTGSMPNNIFNNIDRPVVVGGVSARIVTGQENPEDNLPFTEARARETLTGNEYRHVITFSYDVGGPLGNLYLNIGAFVNIAYDNQTFNSIITGWSLNNTTSLATVTCGNIRSNLQSLVDGLD